MPEAPISLPADPVNACLPLRVRGLRFAIDGKSLIDGLDLAIEQPGISAIMGPNGAGKSLLLRLLHGLLEPTGGEVEWGGRVLEAAVRRQQAMVFQQPVLLRRSVAANIEFVLDRKQPDWRERRDQILHDAGLLHQRRQPARRLSGGEQQRLALARALATGPRVLLLDEPCASLDPPTTLIIEERLRAARAQGIKILLITHDRAQARRLADEVLFMHSGRVVEQQPAVDFFADPLTPAARAYLAGEIVL